MEQSNYYYKPEKDEDSDSATVTALHRRRVFTAGPRLQTAVRLQTVRSPATRDPPALVLPRPASASA